MLNFDSLDFRKNHKRNQIQFLIHVFEIRQNEYQLSCPAFEDYTHLYDWENEEKCASAKVSVQKPSHRVESSA